jgi:predicted transglutaminase-like cysteine proteinase
MWFVRVSAGILCLAGAVAVQIGAAFAESANPSVSQDRASPWMRVFGVTQPPYGVVDLCNREPAECREGPLEDARRQGNQVELIELERVNRKVNREIEPVSDQDLYAVTEYWTAQPRNNQGDCEDYALVKRQQLIKAGWPASALLMTVVLDEKGEGHAILTARTVAGDYVLDNKTDEMKVWHKTPYRFIMRQSYLNPRLWMSLDPKEAAPSVPMAGMRQGQPAPKAR